MNKFVCKLHGYIVYLPIPLPTLRLDFFNALESAGFNVTPYLQCTDGAIVILVFGQISEKSGEVMEFWCIYISKNPVEELIIDHFC